jgi:transcriptional regulator GlxA family with amidase domain
MTMSDSAARPIRDVGVLLIPGFAMISHACAVEPFRAANLLSGRDLYRWRHYSPDGAPVTCSSGMAVTVEAAAGDPGPLDLLLVCAAGNPAAFHDARAFGWLRRLARAGAAGLLDGCRVAIHWEHAPALREAFPRLAVSGALFEIDRGRLTCSGGTAPLDMACALIARDHGRALAAAVQDWFIHTAPRPGDGPQRLPARERFAVAQPRLVRVLEAMETTLDAPLSGRDLAALAGLSQRQLERLFRAHLDRSIGGHYRELRLLRARALLAQSTLSVLEVALGCGFESRSHFSRAYRARFGRPPTAERGREAARPAGAAPRAVSPPARR